MGTDVARKFPCIACLTRLLPEERFSIVLNDGLWGTEHNALGNWCFECAFIAAGRRNERITGNLVGNGALWVH